MRERSHGQVSLSALYGLSSSSIPPPPLLTHLSHPVCHTHIFSHTQQAGAMSTRDSPVSQSARGKVKHLPIYGETSKGKHLGKWCHRERERENWLPAHCLLPAQRKRSVASVQAAAAAGAVQCLSYFFIEKSKNQVILSMLDHFYTPFGQRKTILCSFLIFYYLSLIVTANMLICEKFCKAQAAGIKRSNWHREKRLPAPDAANDALLHAWIHSLSLIAGMCIIAAVPRSRRQFGFGAERRHFTRSSHLTSASCHSAEFQDTSRRVDGEKAGGRGGEAGCVLRGGAQVMWMAGAIGCVEPAGRFPRYFSHVGRGNILNSCPCC